MVANPERVGDDRQSRVHRGARREKAAVDNVEVVDLVRPAIDVERRRPGVMPEADRAVLVAGAGDRQALAEIGVLRQQVGLAADPKFIGVSARRCPRISCGSKIRRPKNVCAWFLANSAAAMSKSAVISPSAPAQCRAS
jgi:hypothetical protein